MESLNQLFDKSKPVLAVILMQFSYAIMSIIAKFALNHGMSPHVLVAYRMAIASALISPFAIVLERKSRPKMTFTIFAKIALISLFEPVLDHNLFYTGMKYTTATFSTAMCNILPTLTFVLACIFKLERVEISRVHSQAKVVGTMVTVGGAMMMTFMKGPALEPPWRGRFHCGPFSTSIAHQKNYTKGSFMLIGGCFCWSLFIISQAMILKSYPAKLSLTAMICTMGAVEGTILALAVERNNTSVWRVRLDSKLIAALYGGLVSAFAIYTTGSVLKKRGPVFVSAFNPLNMVIVAILGSLFLSEEMYLGRVIGSISIVIGLYLVLWGKSKDQPRSKPGGAVVAALQTDQQMAAIVNTETPDPESIIIYGHRVRPLEELD